MSNDSIDPQEKGQIDKETSEISVGITEVVEISAPTLTVTEDKMAVLMDWIPPPEAELKDLANIVRDTLIELGIEEPPPNDKLISWLETTLKKGPQINNSIIVTGKRPVPARHGRVKWKGNYFDTGYLTNNKSGTVDFRQHAAQASVSQNEVLGKKGKLKDGIDGMDVFGQVIPGEKARKYYPTAGKNVEYNEEDETYISKMDGRIRLINGVLSVDEVYIISGSVGIETGDVIHNGSVVIEKDVLEGSRVEAKGDIEVKGLIEAAEVITQGNLTVHGGITRSSEKKIKAGGSVCAKFILNSDVEAGRDIIVDKEIVNSTVKTLNSVIVATGRIVGGETVALRGIQAGQLNTCAFLPTKVISGEHFVYIEKILEKEVEIEDLEGRLAEFKAQLGKSFPSKAKAANADLNHLSSIMAKIEKAEEEYEKMMQALKRKKEELDGYRKNLTSQFPEQELKTPESYELLSKIIGDISKTCESLDKKNEDLKQTKLIARERAKYMIKVEKMLYRATTIKLGDAKLKLSKDSTGPVRVFLEDDKIKILN